MKTRSLIPNLLYDSTRAVLAVVVACTVLYPGWSQHCAAHEVDHYTVPDEDDAFVDLGDYLNTYFINAIKEGVRRTNKRIDLKLGNDGSRFAPDEPKYGAGELKTYDTAPGTTTLAYLQSERAVAHYVRRSIPDAVTLIEGMERELHRDSFKAIYPDGITAFHPSDFDCVYAKVHFPLDPRSLFRIWRSSTFKAYDSYLGTDKIGHFVDMGYHYYQGYHRMRARGLGPRKAMHDSYIAVNSGLLSEKSVLGYVSAGAYSNADMASNYVGCLFYRNLTEPIRLKGKLRPAAVVRDGDYWKLNDHVKGEPDFFSWFISDHYDEALNPSHYEKGMQKAMRRAIEDRLERLMEWYAQNNGEPQPAGYFRYKVLDLATYYNLDYGHSRKFDELLDLDRIREGQQP